MTKEALRLGASLVLAALIFRTGSFLCTHTAQAAPFFEEPPAATQAAVSARPSAPTEAPEPTYPTLSYVPEKAPLRFCAEDAARVRIKNPYPDTLIFDKEAVITRTLNFDARVDGPLVLIVHTHTCEAYTPSESDIYEECEPFRSTSEATGVLRVGARLCEVLNEAGISAIHDTTIHDYPAYSGAYGRMETTVRALLEQYPSVQMVIDLHRDAAENADGSQVALRAEIDGKSAAKLMFVVGSDLAGDAHAGWLDNFACAMQLQALGEAKYAGLFRPMTMRRSSYKQELTPNSLLIEFGAIGNSLEEALYSAELLGALLSELLAGQTGK